jgi:ketosteroid isomerase-like protein
MKRTIITLILLINISAISFAQNDEKTILQLEEQFRVCSLNGDVTTMARMLDDSFYGVNQFGQTRDKASRIELYKTWKPMQQNTENLQVRFAGDNAMVTGMMRERTDGTGGREQHLLFTHVWAKRQNDWRIIFIQQHMDLKEGTVTPKGWNGMSNANFLIGTDTAVKYGGNASAFIKSKHTENSMIGTGLGQQIKADEYRGKRIRLNGWVKGEMNLGHAFCWMRVDDAEGEVLSFDNTLDEGNVLRPDWARFSIVLNVPEKSAVIYLGFQFAGRGQAWLDDWQLEVVGQDVASTHQALTEARQKQIQVGRSMNRAQWEQQIQAMKKRLPTLPSAPVNLDFEAPQK